VRLRMPKIFNLRTDPYERADVTSNSYNEWILQHGYLFFGAFALTDKFAKTFKEFPSVQPPGSFSVDDAMAKMSEAAGSAGH
jgi:arylsulfatase